MLLSKFENYLQDLSFHGCVVQDTVLLVCDVLLLT